MPENLFTKNSIRLFSGQYLDLLNPDPTSIFVVDIAVGLARECRWGNHCKKFYSVAEHSIACMNMAEAVYPDDLGLAFQALMHDAHEAYLGDIPTPLKNLMPEYVAIAKKVQEAINIRFGINRVYHPRVWGIDREMLMAEWKGKMLSSTGLELDERSVVDLFTHHVVRLCKHPIPLQP